ncbi:MAG: hypothetical protein QF561_06220 [Phycisphaerales bacterium]|jgi:hypothetical protein|nr:hypothetical protein [Phycisphaerales bacterium]
MARKPRRTRPTILSRISQFAASTARAPRHLSGDTGAWALILVFFGVLAIVAPRLRAVADRAAPPTDEIRFVATPDWVGGSLIEHLGRVASRQLPDGPPTQGDLAAVHDALDRSGWFDQVRRVRRAADGDIEIEASFLSPVAIVVDDYGEVVIDASGRPLPEGTRMADEPHVIRITGARTNRPSRAARSWQGDDVAAALRLHALLQGRDWADQVQAIDLADFDRTGGLVLMTDLPTRIRWGAAPGEETPLEALADRKLFRLDSAFRNHGRIDQHHTGEIDLTMASHVVQR